MVFQRRSQLPVLLHQGIWNSLEAKVKGSMPRIPVGICNQLVQGQEANHNTQDCIRLSFHSCSKKKEQPTSGTFLCLLCILVKKLLQVQFCMITLIKINCQSALLEEDSLKVIIRPVYLVMVMPETKFDLIFHDLLLFILSFYHASQLHRGSLAINAFVFRQTRVRLFGLH